MPTDTKLNQLIINQLTQEQYDEAKAAGTLSDTELYITDSDDDPQVKSNLSQTIDDSTTKYPSNKAVKDESSRITTLMDTKISNCITYIPQDIKLELNNGTLTLKAGSKVYVPNGKNANGSNIFDEVIIKNDISLTQVWGSSQTFLLFYDTNGLRLKIYDTGRCYSGTTSVSDGAYYNTNDNKLYVYDGGSLNFTASLPIAIITGQSPTITSIDQVFNGFGYIGSTVFALPGVKGLIPNGRNADGSLKSIEFTLDKVLTYNCTMSSYFSIKLEGTEPILGIYGEQLYNSSSNTVIYRGIVYKWMYSGCLTYSNNRITSFTPKTVFHALDYNDKSTISGWSMPSGRFIDLTLGTSGSTYKAPANGYFYLVKVAGKDNADIRFSNKTKDIVQEVLPKTSTNWLYVRMEAQKGDVFEIVYSAIGDTKKFRFIYAEGEN